MIMCSTLVVRKKLTLTFCSGGSELSPGRNCRRFLIFKIMNYQEQVIEIEKLTKSIVKKSKKFVKNPGGPYNMDLLRVIEDLTEADNFLK